MEMKFRGIVRELRIGGKNGKRRPIGGLGDVNIAPGFLDGVYILFLDVRAGTDSRGRLSNRRGGRLKK